MLNIVLFGPPGSGKGTQSEKLIEKYELVHLSTGDLLRSEIANKTELGLKAKAIMEKGELVSDQIVIGMIESRLDQNQDANGFIFDGFPRTTDQAIALDKLMDTKGKSISAMIMLDVEENELVQRLLKRGKETGRTDDNMDTIKNRIKVYNTQTAPVGEFYNKAGKLHVVNGIGTIDEIFGRVTAVIDTL